MKDSRRNSRLEEESNSSSENDNIVLSVEKKVELDYIYNNDAFMDENPFLLSDVLNTKSKKEKVSVSSLDNLDDEKEGDIDIKI